MPFAPPTAIGSTNNATDPNTTNTSIVVQVSPNAANTISPTKVEINYIGAPAPICLDITAYAGQNPMPVVVPGLMPNTPYTGLQARFASNCPAQGRPEVSTYFPVVADPTTVAWTKPTAPLAPTFVSVGASSITVSMTYPNNPLTPWTTYCSGSGRAQCRHGTAGLHQLTDHGNPRLSAGRAEHPNGDQEFERGPAITTCACMW